MGRTFLHGILLVFALCAAMSLAPVVVREWTTIYASLAQAAANAPAPPDRCARFVRPDSKHSQSSDPGLKECLAEEERKKDAASDLILIMPLGAL
jgi:hypothetical protein